MSGSNENISEKSRYAEDSGRRRKHLTAFLEARGFTCTLKELGADNSPPLSESWHRGHEFKEEITIEIADFSSAGRQFVRSALTDILKMSAAERAGEIIFNESNTIEIEVKPAPVLV